MVKDVRTKMTSKKDVAKLQGKTPLYSLGVGKRADEEEM